MLIDFQKHTNSNSFTAVGSETKEIFEFLSIREECAYVHEIQTRSLQLRKFVKHEEAEKARYEETAFYEERDENAEVVFGYKIKNLSNPVRDLNADWKSKRSPGTDRYAHPQDFIRCKAPPSCMRGILFH